MYRVFAVACGVLLFCAQSFADEVVFKNGERLKGTLERIEKGTMVFSSEIAGTVTTDVSRIVRIKTSNPREVVLSDGETLDGELLCPDDGLIEIHRRDAAVLTMPVSRIAAVNPLPPPPVVWSGSLSAGFTSTHGTASSTQLNASFDLGLRLKKHRFKFGGLYLLGYEDNPDADDDPGADDEITTEENLTLWAKYDYFFTKKVYWYLSGRFKKDHVADLDYRIIAGTGLGYQWIESDALKWSTDAGLSLRREKYTTRVYTESDSDEEDEQQDDEDRPAYVKKVDRTNDLSLQLGTSLDWKPYEKTQFLLNVNYTPAFEDFSDYYLVSDAELRLYINRFLYASFKGILEYDSKQAEDIDSTEKKYIVSIGCSF